MPTPLRTPELLSLVFSHLSPSSLARCARTCKSWTDPALDALWRELGDSGHLLKLLCPNIPSRYYGSDEVRPLSAPQPSPRLNPPHISPPPCVVVQVLARSVMVREWGRFDCYARRVRKITVSSPTHSGHTIDSLVDTIARVRPRFGLLPNLRSIECSDFRNAVLFMHKGVTSISLTMRRPMDERNIHDAFLHITLRTPNLT